jgi:hypothetical protein
MAIDTAEKRASILSHGPQALWQQPHVPNGALDIGFRLMNVGFYSGNAPLAVVWMQKGGLWHYDAANWPTGAQIFFQASMFANTGTVHAALYDQTLGARVTASEISTASATLVRVRSAAQTLVDGNDYRVSIGQLDGDDGEVVHATIVVI